MDVVTLAHVYRSNSVIVDVNDSFVKQTYRNRCVIAAANGALTLNIPIVHQGSKNSVAYSSIAIDDNQSWALNHYKSIVSAYRSSPYFEYYEDDLKGLFSNIPKELASWNLKSMKWLCDLLYIAPEWKMAPEYMQDQKSTYLITAKKKYKESLPPYMQVFQEKHGFIEHLSALDLLFNLGPSARDYLKQLDLTT
jgi:hypothetical protein